MSTLGVAIIGLGVGEQHAHAYVRHPQCEVKWLYDVDTHKAQEVWGRVRQGRIAESFEQCIEDESVHILSIASYDEDHYDQIMAGFQAGKHLFVEKPLCQTTEQLRQIHSEWKKRNGSVKLFSNLILRAAPVYRWVKEQCRQNSFGRLFSFDAEYRYGRFYKLVTGWRGQDPYYSVMEGGGIHLIDLMLWLTGERPCDVVCYGNRISVENWQRETQQTIPFQGYDYVAATFRFPSGLTSRIVANISCVHPHQHVVNLYGTKGTFLYDDMGVRVHWGRDLDPQVDHLNMPTLPACKGDLIPEFVQAVQDGLDWTEQTQSIFDAISISVAADHSVQEKKAVEVFYL